MQQYQIAKSDMNNRHSYLNLQGSANFCISEHCCLFWLQYLTWWWNYSHPDIYIQIVKYTLNFNMTMSIQQKYDQQKTTLKKPLINYTTFRIPHIKTFRSSSSIWMIAVPVTDSQFEKNKEIASKSWTQNQWTQNYNFCTLPTELSSANLSHSLLQRATQRLQ